MQTLKVNEEHVHTKITVNWILINNQVTGDFTDPIVGMLYQERIVSKLSKFVLQPIEIR